jgi:hypothetical protein
MGTRKASLDQAPPKKLNALADPGKSQKSKPAAQIRIVFRAP